MIGTPAAPPTAVLLQFTGGTGTDPFHEEGSEIRVGGSFPARTTDMYLQAGLATALLDVPSDRPNGFSQQFRGSAPHMEDAAAAIEQLTARWPDAPLFVVGGSAGTISATNVALTVNNPMIRALILTSTVGYVAAPNSTEFSVADLPIEQLSLPVLMVHHRDDGCVFAPFDGATRVRSRMTSSPKTDFIAVSGGGGRVASADPCAGTAPHTLAGREREVVAAIVDYIAGRRIPEQIG
ncbi:MAG TPA: alpha/beta hydrolase [Chloroflexota bacterium]